MKLTLDLMVINKIIIFSENLIEEDVDYSIFTTKIFNDIDFINNSLNLLFDEFVKNIKHYNNDNVFKIYYSCIKRFHRIISKIIKNRDLMVYSPRNIDFINNIKIDLEKKIEDVKNFNERKNLTVNEKQCINEEEYNILFKTL